MRKAASGHPVRSVVEMLEGRELLSVSPLLAGQQTFPTHTVLTVEAGALGQPITFDVTVYSRITPFGPVDLYFRGKMFQEIGLATSQSSDPRFYGLIGSEGTYTLAAGSAAAQMFGVGRHLVRAVCESRPSFFYASSTVTAFRVTRPPFVTQSSGVGVATLASGSGPALQAGQTATVQMAAYLAATYRPFYSTASQTPGTLSFTVDADPEQVVPGLDAGVRGMRPGETRAIYVPWQLGYGTRGARPAVPPRASLVYLVTLVSIA